MNLLLAKGLKGGTPPQVSWNHKMVFTNIRLVSQNLRTLDQLQVWGDQMWEAAADF